MDTLGLSAQMDQLGATLRDLAPTVAGYYKHLTDDGLPPEVAARLVRDWHWGMWLTVFKLPASAHRTGAE